MIFHKVNASIFGKKKKIKHKTNTYISKRSCFDFNRMQMVHCFIFTQHTFG